MDTGSQGHGSIYESLLALLQGLLNHEAVAPTASLSSLGLPLNLGSVGETIRMARQMLAARRSADAPGTVPSRALASDDKSAGVNDLGGEGPAPGALTGAPLTVQMLDGLQAWIGVEPLADVPRGKARALFKLLVLQRHRPLSRTRLCALLWPEADADHARNSLNVTLHRLRRALGDQVLIRHGESGYQLVACGPVWVDTEQFLQRADYGVAEEAHGNVQRAIGQYEGAASLYRCGLLDEGEAEPALAAEAQALRDRFNHVLERLAALREEAGSLHGCVRATQRHLGVDECNEQAHRRLMRCYARLGQPLLAEQQYRRCVDALKGQLGIAPAAETTELMRRIGRGDAV